MSKRVVVLGAGPAGLATAYQLARGGAEVTVLEREPRVGGLSASLEWEGNILDLGPHAFHLKKGRVTDLVKSLLGDDLLEGIRRELLLMKGKYLRYPVRFYELLFRQSPLLSLRMLFDYAMVNLIYSFIAVPDDTFESWATKRFGKTLYRLFFGNYTAKVWGMPPSKLSPLFAAQKLRKLSLKEVILKLLGSSGEEQENFWLAYLYPRFGSGQIFERMADEIKRLGGRILLETVPTKLQADGERIAKFLFHGREGTMEQECDAVVSSIPLNTLAGLVAPPLGDYPLYKASRVRFRSLILVFLSLPVEKVMDVMWVYLVDTIFKCNRVTEQKNMSVETCEKGTTVLCVEMCCAKDDNLWRRSDEELYKMVLEDLGRIREIPLGSIRGHKVLRVENAYPIYDLGFEKNLATVLHFLEKYRNLLCIGRGGLFLQNDMHDNMEIGMEAAEFVLEGDLDSAQWHSRALPHLGM